MSLPPEAALQDIFDELVARCERENRQETGRVKDPEFEDQCNHKEGHCIRYSREIHMAWEGLRTAKRNRFGRE